MIIRNFKKADQVAVEGIYALYWTDKAFLKELHILAAKYKNKGIGKVLRLKIIEEARRVGPIVAPDGYPGQVWCMSLI